MRASFAGPDCDSPNGNFTCETLGCVRNRQKFAEIERLRAALVIARQCIVESFDYVNDADDQNLADARLQQIDAALGDEQIAKEEK